MKCSRQFIVAGLVLACGCARSSNATAQANEFNTPGATLSTISTPLSPAQQAQQAQGSGAGTGSGADVSGSGSGSGAGSGSGSGGDASATLGSGGSNTALPTSGGDIPPVPATAGGVSPPPPSPPIPSHGFVIDAETCKDPGGNNDVTTSKRAMIDRATEKVDQDFLKCLGDLNPAAEQRARSKLNGTTMIKCAGPNAQASLEGGFQDGNSITLTGADPFGGRPINEGNALNTTILTMGTLNDRMQARMKQNPTSSMGALLFHEFLHVNDFPMGPPHSDQNLADAVYACHLSCGTLETATSQHCLTCASAFGNTPSGDVTSMCNSLFPPFKVVQDVKNAGIFMAIKDKCAAGQGAQGDDADPCQTIQAMPQFQDACGSKGLAPGSADCQSAMQAALKAALNANASDPNFANYSNTIHSAYTKVQAQYQ